jgi:LysM repeat protein
MTTTFHSIRRVDRATPRPIGRSAIDLEHPRSVKRPVAASAANSPSNSPANSARNSSANFAARRGVVAVVAVAVVAVAAFAGAALVDAVGDTAGRSAAAADIAATTPGEAMPLVHVAQSGDTLWSIANRYRGQVDHRRFVDALISLNGDTSIQIGQAIRLP